MSSLRTSQPAFRRLLDALAAFEQLPRWSYRGDDFTAGEVLEGLVLTESSGNPLARRYEPHQDRADRADAKSDPDAPGVDNGVREDDASYGLCQVMGYTLKGLLGADRPVSLDYSLLYRPVFGLAAGLEVLRREIKAVYQNKPTETDSERLVRALARYNGGPTGDAFDPHTSDIRRREYVDLVAKNAKLARDDRHDSGWVVA